MTTSWNIQTALYARLVAALAALTPAKAVYDKVPEGIHNDPKESTRWPFIEIGESIGIPDDTHSSYGQREVITLHVWSRYGGAKQVKQIGDALVESLHHTFWSVTGAEMVYSRVESRRHLDDPDGVTQHGVFEVAVSISEV